MFTIVRKFRLTRAQPRKLRDACGRASCLCCGGCAALGSITCFEGESDVLISIRVFDSADEALASNETAADWIRDNVLEFVKGMPEVMAGNVLVAESR